MEKEKCRGISQEHFLVYKILDRFIRNKFKDNEVSIFDLVVEIGKTFENKKKSIRIPFSEEDLQDLQHGDTFDWTFDEVDVHLFQGEEEEEEG